MANLKQNKIDMENIKLNLVNSALVPDKIVFSSRKSIAIIITDAGELIVRAPINSTEKKIYDFLNLKSNWIIKKRAEMSSTYRPKLKLDGSNESISILGDIYKIELSSNLKNVKRVENKLFVPTNNSTLKLKNYLVKLSRSYISKRVEEIANSHNLKYKSVTIRSSTSRWGSCGYSNSLNFTYKLIMCPPMVVDYIIIHELSHTIEKNHSAKFYKRVESIMPNYRTAEIWLKTNKSIINVI